MMRRFFAASTSITSAAILLSATSLLSRLLGVYRDRLLASTFGASATLDAYYAAFRIPDFVYNIIVLGALSAGFIPVFTEYLERSKEKAWELAQACLIMVSISVCVLGLILYALAPQLITYIAPGFAGETQQLTVQMTRIMLLSPILLGMSSVVGGVLQSFKRFMAYSLAPIFYNLGIIFGIAVFVPMWGPMGLAWGVVMGSTLHFAMQAVVAFRLGWKSPWQWPWKAEGIREIVKLMGPRTLSLAVGEGNFFVVTGLASGLTAGSLSVFYLAHNLAHVPIGLFGISFAVAAFPVLSEYAARGRFKKFLKTHDKTLSSILFFQLPMIVVIMVMALQIVRVVLGSGQFDWNATLTTASALLFLAPHMYCQTLVPLYVRSYYARKNSTYPFIAAIVALTSNMITAYPLSRALGVSGLALSLGISSIIQLSLLAWGSDLRFDYLSRPRMRKGMRQMFAAAFVMAAVMWVAKQGVEPLLNLQTGHAILLELIVTAAVGSAAYLATLKLLKNEEYMSYESRCKEKIHLVFRPGLPVVGTGEEDDVLKQ